MTLARVFQPIPRILTRTFAVPSPAIWIRHRDDGTTASDELKVLFNAATLTVSSDGLETTMGGIRARCAVADALALEPSRAANLDSLFKDNGRDQLVVDSTEYEIESCSVDGYGMCEISLYRKKS
ncbi:hypothetical protein [Gellertiella hungarica]|uniref:Uncharacterized protein n=1 Tax=Gellertiella hungarica TaxID=1572859 RepID=A0A7W6J3E7_9HYPH|nr:hypothetical protein [Gellertiella hungarica]MBB4064050.1 hypothetical protein [Gellertiella hungarica]